MISVTQHQKPRAESGHEMDVTFTLENSDETVVLWFDLIFVLSDRLTPSTARN